MDIRNDQMSQLSDHMKKSFEDRMVKHLNDHFPHKTQPMGEEAVRKSIRKGIERADGYFVERERDVAKFVNLMFLIHPEFEMQPEMAWSKAILQDRTLAGEQKINKLYAELPDRLREMGMQAQKKPGAK